MCREVPSWVACLLTDAERLGIVEARALTEREELALVLGVRVNAPIVDDVLEEIVIVQDSVALARIEANAPVVPYPLLREDRRGAPVLVLMWYALRLLVWRARSRYRAGS